MNGCSKESSVFWGFFKSVLDICDVHKSQVNIESSFLKTDVLYDLGNFEDGHLLESLGNFFVDQEHSF